MPHLATLLAENSLFKAVGDLFHPLFILLGSVISFIYGVVPNYMVAIVLLTILIMAILTPLTVKSTKSMLAMQTLQPEMQKLRQKYAGPENRQVLNQEMMKLYKDNGVSPTGGCLPMFLQMPALVVLYDVIKGLANTVNKGATLASGKVCHPIAGATVCATPRYIPQTSLMHHNLVETPGVMRAFGMNLAAKPLSHHTQWIDYIPYIALVVVAVGLQYFQMAQMTRRNKKTGTEVPQQMQTMQKFMPVVFAYIYFLVPAGVVIYMIVSSAIRVLTQDLIFRFGLVDSGGQRRTIGGSKAKGAPPAPTKGSGSTEGRKKGPEGAAEKAHPRSRAKRSRKAR